MTDTNEVDRLFWVLMSDASHRQKVVDDIARNSKALMEIELKSLGDDPENQSARDVIEKLIKSGAKMPEPIIYLHLGSITYRMASHAMCGAMRAGYGSSISNNATTTELTATGTVAT